MCFRANHGICGIAKRVCFVCRDMYILKTLKVGLLLPYLYPTAIPKDIVANGFDRTGNV